MLPRVIPAPSVSHTDARVSNVPLQTQSDFINDVAAGISQAPMAIRLTPHVLSLIDWAHPLDDPLLRQFVPLGSRHRNDHPMLRLDSLDEAGDSPMKGLIHRYPDKVVFLGQP